MTYVSGSTPGGQLHIVKQNTGCVWYRGLIWSTQALYAFQNTSHLLTWTKIQSWMCSCKETVIKFYFTSLKTVYVMFILLGIINHFWLIQAYLNLYKFEISVPIHYNYLTEHTQPLGNNCIQVNTDLTVLCFILQSELSIISTNEGQQECR